MANISFDVTDDFGAVDRFTAVQADSGGTGYFFYYSNTQTDSPPTNVWDLLRTGAHSQSTLLLSTTSNTVQQIWPTSTGLSDATVSGVSQANNKGWQVPPSYLGGTSTGYRYVAAGNTIEPGYFLTLGTNQGQAITITVQLYRRASGGGLTFVQQGTQSLTGSALGNVTHASSIQINLSQDLLLGPGETLYMEMYASLPSSTVQYSLSVDCGNNGVSIWSSYPGFGYYRLPVFADGAGVTDSISTLLSHASTFTDLVGTTDGISRDIDYGRTQNDNGGLSDSTTRIGDFQFQQDGDTGLTDRTIIDQSPTIDDDTGLTDPLTRVASYVRTFNDDGGLSDNSTPVTNYVRTPTDPAGTTDLVGRDIDFGLPTDNSGLTESISTSLGVSKTVNDSTWPTDSFSRVANYDRNIPDPIWPTDHIVNINIDRVKTINEQTWPTDDATPLKTLGIQFDDPAGISDDIVQSVGKGVTDTSGLTDTVVPVLSVFTKTDPAGLTDSITRDISTSPTDTTGLVDSATSALTPFVIDDPTGLSDSHVEVTSLGRTFTDTTGLVDNETETISLVLSDATGTTDTFSSAFGTLYTATPTDPAGNTDSITKSFEDVNTDVANPTDSINKDVSTVITDDSGATDNVALSKGANIFVTDDTGLGNGGMGVDYAVVVTDSTGNTDSMATLSITNFIVNDSANMYSNNLTMVQTMITTNKTTFLIISDDKSRKTDDFTTFVPKSVNLQGTEAVSTSTALVGTVTAVKVTIFGGGKSTYPWRYVKPLPSDRVFSASVAIANRLYLFGGVLDTGVVSTESMMYDYATDKWTALAPMPAPKCNAAAAALDGKIIVAGGLDTTILPAPTSYIYDIDTDTWTNGPSTPSVWGHTLVAHPERNEIYWFGGYARSRSGIQYQGPPTGNGTIWNINRPIRGGAKSGSDKLQRFVYMARLTDATFSTVGNMAQGMALHSSSKIGNTFYHSGGNGNGIPTGVSQAWSIGDVSAVLTPGPTVGSYSSSSTYGNLVFFHGGGDINTVTGEIDVSAQTIAYDTVLQTWEYFPDMEAARLGCTGGTLDTGLTPEKPLPFETRKQGVISVDTMVYAFGGEKLVTTGPLYSFAPSSDVYLFDTVAQTVVTNNMPMPLTNVTARNDSTIIYITGTNGGTAYFWAYDTLTGTYTSLPTYSGMENGGGMCVIAPYVYFFQNGQVSNSQMRRYHILDGTWEVLGGFATFDNRNDVECVDDGLFIYIATQGEMYTFDTVNLTYAIRGAAPLTDPQFKLAIFQNYIHAISRTDGSRWYFGLTTNTWTKEARRITPRLNSNIAATADKLYYVGGHHPLTLTGTAIFNHDARNMESWTGFSGFRSIVAGGELESLVKPRTPDRLKYTEILSVAAALPPKRAGISVNPLSIYYDDMPSYLL